MSIWKNDDTPDTSAPEVHPACLLLPEMADDEFSGLKADIKKHGQRRPILVFEGKILDGRHRARACQELGIVARFEPWSGSDPVAFVLSENLYRRHLSASQRAMIAAAAMTFHTDAAKARQQAGSTLASREATPPFVGKAAAAAAVAVGVSRASVERAAKVAKDGTPEDVRDVTSGKATVGAKVREIAGRKAQPNTSETFSGKFPEHARRLPVPGIDDADMVPAVATTPAQDTGQKPKPTGKEAMQRAIAVTGALGKLQEVDSALIAGDREVVAMVEALEAALERYRPLAEQGVARA